MAQDKEVNDILEAVEEGLGLQTLEKAQLDSSSCCQFSCKCMTMSLGVFVVWALYATALISPAWTVQTATGVQAKSITQQMGPLSYLTSYTYHDTDKSRATTISRFGLLSDCEVSIKFSDPNMVGATDELTTLLSSGDCDAQQMLLAACITALASITLSLMLTCLSGRKGFQATQRYAAVTAFFALLSWVAALVAILEFSHVHSAWKERANQQNDPDWHTTYGNGVILFLAAGLITPLAAYPSFSTTMKFGKEWSRM